MSKVLHRRPTWGWSVVLLSTLLLSPATAQALMHALHVATAAPVRTAADAAAEGPRRRGADDEEALLRAARLAAEGEETRIDPAPEGQESEDASGGGSAAAPAYVLLPAQTVLLVPDEAPVGKASLPPPDALRPASTPRLNAPRAPPA